MSEIVPTILAENPEIYKQQMENVQVFATRLHIDFTDGNFAENQTIPLSDIWWPENVDADIHAMVQKPEDYLADLIRLRPNMVLFHAESEGNLPSVFVTLQQYGIKAGLVLLRKTVPANAAELMMQLEKVRLIKKINPLVEIGWDGGVTIDNAYSLVQGGVDILNVGGAIQFADNSAAAYKKLVIEINRRGVL